MEGPDQARPDQARPGSGAAVGLERPLSDSLLMIHLLLLLIIVSIKCVKPPAPDVTEKRRTRPQPEPAAGCVRSVTFDLLHVLVLLQSVDV
ncbi:uncharacterized protein V6R79_011554 [Siganus canaliculatus]